MSNHLETQTAYQRWELASFNEEKAPKSLEDNPMIAKLAQEMIVARDEAYQEGFTQGLADGNEQGFKEGLTQGYDQGFSQGQAEVMLLTQELTQLIEGYTQHIQQAKEDIAQAILQLTLDIAKAMLKASLVVQPERIIPIIEQALQSLYPLQLPASLYANPEDIEIIHQVLGDELNQTGWRIISDPQIQRGGCYFKTASNEIDASLETRWQFLCEALGQNNIWLASTKT